MTPEEKAYKNFLEGVASVAIAVILVLTFGYLLLELNYRNKFADLEAKTDAMILRAEEVISNPHFKELPKRHWQTWTDIPAKP